MNVQVSQEVRVVPFDERLARDFAELNYAWISRYYGIEPHDRELLDDPAGQIIDRGGEIFFALIDEAVVGAVALIELDKKAFELAKMAVSTDHQGKGIGRALLAKCIEHARDNGKVEIILESNTRQAAAVHLYRIFGFEEIPLDPNSAYARVNIRMRLALS